MKKALVVFVVLTGCSGVVSDATTTSTSPPSESTTTSRSDLTSTSGATGTTNTSPPPTTSTTLPLPLVSIEGGTVTGIELVEVSLGETVDVIVTSDAAGEVHVHGYDLFFELEPGAPLDLSFVADIPGVFEVELEGSHLLLFEIEVTG